MLLKVSPMPPILRKKLPWLKSFSDVLYFFGLLSVDSFSPIPSGSASRGRF